MALFPLHYVVVLLSLSRTVTILTDQRNTANCHAPSAAIRYTNDARLATTCVAADLEETPPDSPCLLSNDMTTEAGAYAGFVFTCRGQGARIEVPRAPRIYSVSQKNIPLMFSDIFSQTVGNF